MSAKITTEGLTDLNKQTDIDQKDPDDVAKTWLKTTASIPATQARREDAARRSSSARPNFTEDETLADIYADVLKANGYPVTKKLKIGSREIYFPALKSGEVSFIPDYAGSLLTFLDPKKPATTDPADQRHAARGRA